MARTVSNSAKAAPRLWVMTTKLPSNPSATNQQQQASAASTATTDTASATSTSTEKSRYDTLGSIIDTTA